MVEIGSGTPVVFVPGLQGRWEWKRRTVEAVGRRQRAIAYSLCDERRSGFAWEPARGFENYVTQLGEVLDRARVERAALVGVSYGGLIAAEFAARFPKRVSHLMLASALCAPWAPDARARFYLRAPRLLFPLFAISAPRRMAHEVLVAVPGVGARVHLAAITAARFLRTPVSPSRMARRIRWAEAHTFADQRTIAAPTLLITGEPDLDKVVPVGMTRRYLDLIPSARHVVLPRTGHLGVITKPEQFAAAVEDFIDARRAGTSVPAA